MSIIQTTNVHKTYEGAVPVHAVQGVTLEIEAGEFTALVGPSGSGKTTLLNMIGGLDPVTSGSVVVDGTEVTQLKGNELIDFRLNHIGFVFQAYNLIPVLTARENVEFTMLLQGRSQQERDARTAELLQEVGLGEIMDKRPAKMSGGQQQRVAVARALAPKPQFILADEPTANLDSASTTTLLDLMAELNEKEGVTFLFSTHDQRVIDRARRVITLEDGKIVSDVRK
ncbi:MAG: ABC transporter ATP-binding protein [Bacteroidota bacterium]